MNLHEIYLASQLAGNSSEVDLSDYYTKSQTDDLTSDLQAKINHLEKLVFKYHDVKIYGYHINPNEPDSSEAVTYLADAVGMTPAKMGTTTFDYGSWKNAFFMPKPCMLKYDGTVAYYLDPNDYTKKLDGTPSDVANPNFEGNAMMEWGQIWYKFVGGNEDGEGYFYVSNCQVDESYHCWCNYDAKNNITQHFYTAIYNSTLHNGKFRSLSGVALTRENGSGFTTAQQEINYCKANNTTSDVEWYMAVYADRVLINSLLVLIGKSLHTQAVFGLGLDTYPQTQNAMIAKESYVTGNLNKTGLFYGVKSNGNSGVKAFGMENWWGCVCHRTAGFAVVSNKYKIKLTYGTADGSTSDGYESKDGYITLNYNLPGGGFIKKCRYDEYGYLPCETGGSNTTYYADFAGLDRSDYVLFGGNDGFTESKSGAFFMYAMYAFGEEGWGFSTTLSCKPVVNVSSMKKI